MPITWIFVLTACGMTDPDFAASDVTRIQIGTSVFDVRQRGDKALAVRMNPEPPQRYETAMARAMLAIEQATGCRVARAAGDPSAAKARLDCGPGSRVPQTPITYDCDAFEVIDDWYELECTEQI